MLSGLRSNKRLGMYLLFREKVLSLVFRMMRLIPH